tara:strand:- start:399 stop:1229 length:831 start_codon:yes stop_codon:yes gene_type:complete
MSKNKLVILLVFLFVFLAVPKTNNKLGQSLVEPTLTFPNSKGELHVFPQKSLLDFEGGDFENLSTILDDFFTYSSLYRIKVAVPEEYAFSGDLEEFINLFLPNIGFSSLNIVNYSDEDFGTGGFVVWLNENKSISREKSIQDSLELLKEEEFAILKEGWLTKVSKKQLPYGLVADGWVVIEHPYRTPKLEFASLDNVSFLELDLGSNVDFLKKKSDLWIGKIKIMEVENIIGSFCFSFCKEDEKITRLPIFLKTENGKITHWSSGYPPVEWLFDEQ